MKKKQENLFIHLFNHLKKRPMAILIVFIFLLAVFLRFFEINERTPFGWDQVDNAWASMRLITEGKFPLVGMQAKGNSGVFIGPFYYYFASFFYFITNLDPIAIGIIAGVTSIFSLAVLYFVTKRLFSTEVAVIAVFINTVSSIAILSERVQWPVNFIPVVGLLILFSLYKIAEGKSKYILLLSVVFGFSLHIHFTSIFYPIIILFMLPFFPRTKETIKYILLGAVVLIPFIIPTAIAFYLNTQSGNQAAAYGQSYYHGFHLRRVMQLTSDAVIQFLPYLKYDALRFLQYLLIPLFIFVYLFKKVKRERVIMCYLILLFYIVPWFVLSTYSGELTDYYFLVSRFVSLIIISYLIYRVYALKFLPIKVVVVSLLLMYAYFNIKDFFSSDTSNSINTHREKTLESIERKEFVEYHEGVPETFLYYYYMRKDGKKVY